jgi:hypothetical protein
VFYAPDNHYVTCLRHASDGIDLREFVWIDFYLIFVGFWTVYCTGKGRIEKRVSRLLSDKSGRDCEMWE